MQTIHSEFGDLQINEQDIIHFNEGLYGFEDVKDYVLISHDEPGVIMTMQPVDGQIPQFVVLDPYAITHDFAPVLSHADMKLFKNTKVNDLKFLVIAVVKENYLETVVNLKSPIVINPQTRIARH